MDQFAWNDRVLRERRYALLPIDLPRKCSARSKLTSKIAEAAPSEPATLNVAMGRKFIRPSAQYLRSGCGRALGCYRDLQYVVYDRVISRLFALCVVLRNLQDQLVPHGSAE